MSTQETRQHLKFGRSARNLGISALLAVTIGGYALHERTAVAADALQPIQWSQIAVTAEATAGATAEATEPTGQYRDGEYTGQSVRTGQHWGNTQITAIITGGKLTDFKVNDYPHSTGRSLRISQVALPDLMQEAIQVQSASVDIISGATQTTEAFMESLQSALEQASTAVTPSPTPTLTPTGSSV